ncbi:LacI family DNA-binding transcriptional regulator [Roseobacter sp. YSTF-M11]|uniref:LacI family DNA-binding transcriptional regulator n=1 Tax=Roseobacter insulae TaxID=2859783 RepID=A0A9X1FSY5_9RHOB|nr:LacI family DNA-binding transcriptional regulator [Roseobacter insulae]MBW4707181.1 LacI family DNA-binding transcriptional regulator [Roseobacter insulae]
MVKDSKPTKIEDVAARANVSIMSVSRAIRGVEGVSEKKRAEILRLAREMKYVPNSNARSLAVANSNLIGISLPTFAGEVFADILNGMRKTFDSAGYSSVIDTTEYSPEAELNWVRRLLSWQPAGIILTGTDHTPETQDLLRAAPIPVLEIWDQSEDPIDICVGIDHFKAGQMIGEHAVALGYARPAFVSTARGHDTRADARLEGVREVFARLKSAPVLSSRIASDNNFATGFQGTSELLSGDVPDLICYLNDHMAFGGMMSCQAKGLSVPDDIGIIGFNELDLASVLPMELTTVRTLRKLMGIVGARNLLARINGAKTDTCTVLPIEFVPGQTTRPQ